MKKVSKLISENPSQVINLCDYSETLTKCCFHAWFGKGSCKTKILLMLYFRAPLIS